jgi:hypothetical protein
MSPTRTLLCSLIAACACAPALAALGGDATSVEADRASLNGTLRVSPADGYVVHEIQASGGMLIHEYLSPAGRVFAVSWHGPGIPDLRQMLGSYYASFTQAQAASSAHYNHHHLSIRTPDLVVESQGHARAFRGVAWAPALLPQNFSVSQIN